MHFAPPFVLYHRKLPAGKPPDFFDGFPTALPQQRTAPRGGPNTAVQSKRAAKEIREDFLADLGYEFDDSGCYCGEENHCCDEAHAEKDSEEKPMEE